MAATCAVTMDPVLGAIDRVLARVGKHVVHCGERDGVLTVEASSAVRAAPCPVCHRWSRRLHGSYVRFLEERQILESWLVLAVQMHRFKCPSAECPRRTFTENIGALAGRHQRRTHSQARALQALGHALGGQPAARLASALGLAASADTVLRHLRRAAVPRRRPKPRVVGIDDWAVARGHSYGTIAVDLERREPLEVFLGREADAVTKWLRAHPTIEIVVRDRAKAYAQAAAIALPHAQQVCDRWHLLDDLRDNVQRMLQRMGPQMREAARHVTSTTPPLGRQGPPRGARLCAWQRLSDGRREIRLALYNKVMALHAQGGTMKGIGRQLGIDHRTVGAFVRAAGFPERSRRARGPTQLDMHLAHIEARVAQGCLHPRQIWKELRDRGYTGSFGTVQSCVVRLLHPQGKPSLIHPVVHTMPCPSARRAFGWLVGWSRIAVTEPKHVDHERFVRALCRIEPVVAQVRSLCRQFLGLMRRRRVREFDRWFKRLSRCEAVEMKAFARSLAADMPAVRAAFKLPWSNGQTEGHVNRLKFLKRQMYGRASVELLRLRVLSRS